MLNDLGTERIPTIRSNGFLGVWYPQYSYPKHWSLERVHFPMQKEVIQHVQRQRTTT
jgi:hypothetical protein